MEQPFPFPPQKASTAAVQEPTQSSSFTTSPAAYPQGYMPGMAYMPMQLPSAGPMTDPGRQEQLGQLTDVAMNKYKQALQSNRGSETGAQIFANTIAPAMAIFGGPGTSAAGVQLIKDTQQDIKNNRMLKVQEEKHYADVLKGLTDIGNTTGFKPFQELIRARQKDAELEQKGVAQAATASFHQAMQNKWKTDDARIQKIADGAQALRARGLNIDENRLAQIKESGEKQRELTKQLAILNAQMTARGQNIHSSQFAQQLAQQLKIHKETTDRLIQQHDSDMQMKLQEMQKDTKTGKLLPKYADENGKMLDWTQYAMGNPQIGISEDVEPSQQDYASVDAMINNLNTAVPPPAAAAPAAGASPAAAFKPQFQSIAQQSGLKPDQAKQMFMEAAMRKGGMTWDQAVEAARGL
jgi:hypothetical protein